MTRTTTNIERNWQKNLDARYKGWRSCIIDEPTCNRLMRSGDRNCQMEAGHRGQCSTRVFVCEDCGKRRRGDPMRGQEAILCFMCVRVYAPRWY